MSHLKIKLKTTSEQSRIVVGKYIKIPCHFEGSRYYRDFVFWGILHCTVIFCDTEGTVYVYPFKKSKLNFALKIKKKSMKARHYRDLIRNNYDESYISYEIQTISYKKLGYIVNLQNPLTFNEKIIWTKLNERNPLVTVCCDKYAVKNYVKDTIEDGWQYTLPVLKKWDDVSQINFDELPDQFVIKVNWSSGYNIIVKDKTKINKFAVLKIIDKWIQPESNSYYHFFNYGYKNVKPVIYVEPYIEECSGRLNDYKFFINNGKLAFVLMASERFGEGKGNLTYYDANLNKLPFTRGNKNNEEIAKPEHYDLMLDLALKLSKPFKFVRVDFYEDKNHKVYVGEMTFYTGGGVTKFNPPEWDSKLGSLITL